MSEENKTENRVFEILRHVTKQGLEAYEAPGFEVRRFAQANFVNGDGLVLLNLVGTNNIGWQATKYRSSGIYLKRSEEYIEEQHWQFHFLKKMQPKTDTVETITAHDCCMRILAWFNKIGCEKLRQFGIANTYIDQSKVLVYNDDSNVYQRRCVFTVKVQVPKALTTRQDFLDISAIETCPV